MENDLLEQLDLWHKNSEYGKIEKRILQIPEMDRDYELHSHLARAMNNLERYEDALRLLVQRSQCSRPVDVQRTRTIQSTICVPFR